MIRWSVMAASLAAGIAMSGGAFAQTATPPATAPAANPTRPPERLDGSTTTNNPATAGTPAPGSASSNNAVSTSPANTPAAPVSGANSFTEGQARSRIEDRGYNQITDLKLDAQGVWRGQAMKDGKSVAVALDYQGNVVAH